MNRLQVRITQIYILILSAIAVWLGNYTLLFMALLLGWALQGIGLETLIHRKYAHNQFEYRNIFWELWAYLIMISTGTGRPIEWAYGHRVHHRYTDQAADPQSPHSIGWVRTWFSIFPDQVEGWQGIIDDLTSNPRLVLFNRYYYHFYLGYNLIWFAISPELAVYFVGIPAFIAWLSLGTVNTQGHRVKGQANNFPASILFWGVNNHAEHHDDPRKQQLGKWDLSGYAIKIMAKAPEINPR